MPRTPLLLLLTAPLALAAQQAPAPRQLTDADYARAERFLAASVAPRVAGIAGRPTFLDDGRFWYRVSTVGGGGMFYLVDPARRRRIEAFDHQRLAEALSRAGTARVDADRLPFTTFDLSADARTLTATIRGARWRCDLTAYTCAEQPRGVAAPANARLAPDGAWAVFIREHDLWAREMATGTDRRLTTDGQPDFGYATNNAGWVHGPDPVVTWSPDGQRIATFQHDGRGVREMHLTTTNVGVPRLESWKYPLPGDSVIFRISRVVVDVAAPGGPRVVRFRMPPDQHRSTVSDHVNCGGAVCDVQWYPDGSHVAFISSSRDHKQVWLRVADAATGEVRDVLHETSATQIGDASLPEDLWRVLPATNEVIWWSQRDDWVHLSLHDLTTGRLKHRITTGTGNVSGIVRVDEQARRIWFTANGREPGRDPYFQHLYRVNFDGTGLTLLTPEAANHTVALSPDGRYVVDTWSTPDTPPVTVLRDANGRALLPLERADVSGLVATGWRPPVPFTVKARDGVTDLYGLMYLPTQLDTTRRYPIVNYIYPGPQSGSVGSRSFVPARSDHQALAELGFVVVAIDGMGTPGRSKSFHDAYYGRMGDNTIPDQIAGMRQLAARHRWIDLDKVGIWGHSGGGFATGAAMLRHPEFFKVGIAESGNHDNRNYEDDWGERYQGLLVRQGDTDNYAAEANQTYAAQLRGKLFLIHGMMDDNVPASNTLLVADALVKAGKDFDLLMLPHARHGFAADGPYVMRRRWDYFVQHLQGNVPPKEYRIGQPRAQP
jgi:dipeptidyl aminopeptidase/acylaminoacyl peptidase